MSFTSGYLIILVNIIFNGCIVLCHMDGSSTLKNTISTHWMTISRLRQYDCKLGVLSNYFNLNHSDYCLRLALIYCTVLENIIRGLTHKMRNTFPIWPCRNVLWVKWDVRHAIKNYKGPHKCKMVLFLMLSFDGFVLRCLLPWHHFKGSVYKLSRYTVLLQLLELASPWIGPSGISGVKSKGK